MIAAACVSLVGCSPSSGPKNTVNIVEKRAELPNGMKLVVMPDPDNSMVQVDVRYEVGAKEDYQGRAGLAHLVEHMMFQHRFGPDETPIEERLPTFQMLPHIATGYNAYTNWDTTHYYLQAPAEDVEKLMRLEAGRLGMGCKTIPPEQFEREREVVRNEIRQRMGTPEGAVLYQILRNVYPAGHPYSEMIGGDDAQLASITFDDVCRFMGEYYMPNRATLMVTGNVDAEEVGKLAMKYFGGLEKREPGKLAQPEPLVKQYNEKTIEAAIERDVVSVSFPLPPQTSDEYDSVSRMLFSMSFILDNLVKEWKIGRVFDSSGTGKEERLPGIVSLGGAHAPILSIQLELYPGKDPKEALGYIWKAVDIAKRNTGVMLEDGSYASEKLSKTLFKQQMVQIMESLSARNQFMATWIQFDKRLQPDFISEKTWMYEVLNRFGDISESKYKKLVKKVLDKKKATVLIVKANKSGLTGDKRAKLAYKSGAHENREVPPVARGEWDRPLKTPSSESILSKVEKYTLSNGMNVMLLPYKTMPVVKAQLIVNAGSVNEKESEAGVADAALKYLAMQSADVYDRAKMRMGSAEVFNKTGVRIQGRAGRDYSVFSASGMSSYLETILKGIERLMLAGEIAERDMEDYRAAFKRNYKRESFQRNDAFQVEIAKAVYGADHPYTTKGSPVMKSINNISRDSATNFIRNMVKPKDATLIVVGNFDPIYAKKVIKENYGNHGRWSGGKGKVAVPESSADLSKPKFIGVVGSDNSSQIRLNISYPVASGTAAEKYGLRLILAQMLNKRMSQVRSKLGSTYGTYAGYSRALGPSRFSIGGTIDASRAGESVKFIREQIEDLRNSENFKVEFAEARRVVLKKTMAVSNETGFLAYSLTQMAVFELGADNHDSLVREIANSTPAQVKTVLETELPPNKEVLAVLGARKVLDSMFSEVGIQSPTIVEPKSL